MFKQIFNAHGPLVHFIWMHIDSSSYIWMLLTFIPNRGSDFAYSFRLMRYPLWLLPLPAEGGHMDECLLSLSITSQVRLEPWRFTVCIQAAPTLPSASFHHGSPRSRTGLQETPLDSPNWASRGCKQIAWTICATREVYTDWV